MAKQHSRKIDVLLYDGVNILDVAGPAQAFESATERAVTGKTVPGYRLRFVSRDGNGVRASCGLHMTADAAISSRSDADDLLVPGGVGVDACLDDVAILSAAQHWMKKRRNGRLISVCSGALILAASGALDGETATTHWARAATVRQRFPAVDWQLNRIYIMGERLFTSAGVTTGIDMALAIIRRDYGPDVALAVGRELVVQMQRSGGQEQFSVALTAQQNGTPALSRLVERIVADPAQPWTLQAMSDAASISPRSLTRKFTDHLGMTPAKFVERVRIDHARDALVNGADHKSVAARSGFGDAQRMRRAFTRHLGVSATTYADSFADPVDKRMADF